MFKKLGVKANKKEVEEMIWEVDEDLNGRIDWSEFRLMYMRNINDKTGLEPSRLVCMNEYTYECLCTDLLLELTLSYIFILFLSPSLDVFVFVTSSIVWLNL